MRTIPIYHTDHPLYNRINGEIDKLIAHRPVGLFDTDPAYRPRYRSLLDKMQHRIPPIQPTDAMPNYVWQVDRIFMPDPQLFCTREFYYSVLFHEIVHSTGHPSRLNRPELLNCIKPDDALYCQEHLIAAHGAAYLCALAGTKTQTIVCSARFIQARLYELRADQTSLPAIRAKAQEAIAFLLAPRVSITVHKTATRAR